MKFNTLVALFATASAVKIAQNDEADMEDQVANPVEDDTIDAEAQEADAMAEEEYHLNKDEYSAYDIHPLIQIDHCYKFINRAHN